MFKFLKEKLKSAISNISQSIESEGKAEEKAPEEPKEIITEPEKQEKGFFAKLKEKFARKEAAIEEKKAEIEPGIEIENEEPKILESEEEKEQIITEHKKIHKEHKGLINEIKQPLKKIQENTEPQHEIKEMRKVEVKKEQLIQKIEPQKTEEQKKKGFFSAIKERILTTRINEGQFEKLFWNLEMALMENNVAIEVIEKIKNDLKNELVEKPITRTKVEDTVVLTLKGSIEGLFQNNSIDLIREIKNKKEKPYVIAFFGINGSGKTTSIAKIANMLKNDKISCVLAASDTFRAASIEQLQQHADKIGIKVIKHDYGADPAAVAFDAIKHAKSKNIDVVLIDTAGRMHSNQNLIDEMKKIIRVAKPDLKIFVGESITGNDCVEQAKTFNDAVGIDGIILAKADIDEKGGAAVSVSYVTKKPIIYLGVGQSYNDLELFNKEKIIKSIGLA